MMHCLNGRLSNIPMLLFGCCGRSRTYIIWSSVELIYSPNMSTESRAYTTIIWRRGGGNDPPRATNPCNSFQGCSAHLCTDPSVFNLKCESGIATDQRSRHIFRLHRNQHKTVIRRSASTWPSLQNLVRAVGFEPTILPAGHFKCPVYPVPPRPLICNTMVAYLSLTSMLRYATIALCQCGRTRTCDLLVPNQTDYQLSHVLILYCNRNRTYYRTRFSSSY